MSGAAIYLDHAATTAPTPEVVDAMVQAQREAFGNPSSLHGFAERPRRLLEDAREFLRGTLHAAGLVFTSGGTEADLLGVLGAVLARGPGRVLTGAGDHAAVLAQAPLLARLGCRITQVPLDPQGDIDPETFFGLLGPDVAVVALLHGHNELGTIPRTGELVELVRRACPRAHVHVDLVQAYGKVGFDLDALDVDTAAVSGHKFHGPRGAGFLALSSTARVGPVQAGGGQEHGLRGGTENVAGAVGLARAAEQAFTGLAAHAAAMEEMRAVVLERLRGAFADLQVLGHPERRLPHILALRIPGVVAHTLLTRLDARGVAVSTGAACHGDAPENHVHRAIGLDRRASREVLRLSFARTNTPAEAAAAAAILVDEARALLQVSPKGAGAR
ncbi:MAG: cysteine desulfurase [Planctomycetes bacterium]|nr:cysteine desulfurase [Planctomycetota bacterium]